MADKRDESSAKYFPNQRESSDMVRPSASNIGINESNGAFGSRSNNFEQQYEIEEPDNAYPVENERAESIHSESPSKHSKAKSKGNASKAAKSLVSGMSSSSHSSDADGRGREIADVGVKKIIFMKYSMLSLVLHLTYLVILCLFNRSTGLVLPFEPQSFLFAGPAIMFALALCAFFINEMAMNDAFAGGAGYLLSKPEGFSIAICGFNHASTLGKILFPWYLKPTSKLRFFFAGCGMIWGLHASILPLTFIASMGISTKLSRVDAPVSLMCLTYSQRNSAGLLRLKDRQIPTLTMEMGVAELIDGTALGLLRSSDSLLSHTTHYLPPQLTDVCQDGSTIIGNGFKTDIASTCACSSDATSSSFTSFGGEAATLAANVSGTLANPLMVNYATYANRVITLYTVLAGTNSAMCKAPSLPVCTTKISNHQIAKFLITYKTDGTPASIAAEKVALLNEVEDADMVTLYGALSNQLGSKAASTVLPPTFTDTVNPMLWMMSSNTRNVSSELSKIEPGMEYIAALILRSSMQRSYVVTGGFCQENVVDETTVTLFISSWAFGVGAFWAILQIVNIVGFACLYIPWFLSSVPIYPGIQIAQDSIMFTLLACKNVVTYGKIKSFRSSVDSAIVWAKMDMVLRVGESVLSQEDPERGVIVLDKPKMVTELSYEKTYV